MKELWKVCRRGEVGLTWFPCACVVYVANLPRFSCYCLSSGRRTSICTLEVWISLVRLHYFQLLINWFRFQNILLRRARSRSYWIRQYVYILTLFAYAVASVLTWTKAYFSTLLASTLISRFLDYRGLSIRNRIKYRYRTSTSTVKVRLETNKVHSFFYVIVVHIVAWVYCWVIQEKYTKNPPTLDWADKGFVEGFFVILLWGELGEWFNTANLLTLASLEFTQQSLQNFLYYLLSTMTDNISELCKLNPTWLYYLQITDKIQPGYPVSFVAKKAFRRLSLTASTRRNGMAEECHLSSTRSF